MTTRRAAIAAGFCGLAVFFGWWLFGKRRPPQIGPDEEAELAVDALFTAMTAHDQKLLAECEERLHALRDSEQLPEDASEFIDGTVQLARAGKWRPAADRLYDFMKQQRR